MPPTLDTLPTELVEAIALHALVGLPAQRCIEGPHGSSDDCSRCRDAQELKEFLSWRLVSRRLSAKLRRLFMEHCFAECSWSHLESTIMPEWFALVLKDNTARYAVRHIILETPRTRSYRLFMDREKEKLGCDVAVLLSDMVKVWNSGFPDDERSVWEQAGTLGAAVYSFYDPPKHTSKLLSIFNQLPNLRQVTLHLGCIHHEFPAVIAAVLNNSRPVECLRVTRWYFLVPPVSTALASEVFQQRNASELKTLQLYLKWNESAPEDSMKFRKWTSFLARFKGLETLRVGGPWARLFPTFFSRSLTGCYSKLADLAPGGFKFQSQHLLQFLRKHNTTLKSLWLSGIKLADGSWADIISTLISVPRLQEIFLRDLIMGSRHQFCFFVHGGPHAEHSQQMRPDLVRCRCYDGLPTGCLPGAKLKWTFFLLRRNDAESWLKWIDNCVASPKSFHFRDRKLALITTKWTAQWTASSTVRRHVMNCRSGCF